MNFRKLIDTRVMPIKETLEKIMVGQKQVIKRVTMALFAVGQRDFTSEGTRFLGSGHVLCEGGVGTGKCLGKGTPILMFDGTIKLVENIKVGDLLMGPDSTSREVISLGHGFGKMYKVIPESGTPYIVNDDHILSLKHKGLICNITAKDYFAKGKKFKLKTKGYTVAVDFPEIKVSIDPYLLGTWLGNDLITKKQVNLLEFGEKCIPHTYKVNSRSIRLQILAGIIDSNKDCITKNKKLAEDIVFLAKSLGFAVNMQIYMKNLCKNYKLTIAGNISQIPVKNPINGKKDKNVLDSKISVVPIGYDEYFGFEIKGPDRLFLLGDFTVTHNTVLCKALSRLLAGNNKRVSGLPDAIASDIVGCDIILLSGETKTVQGPLFCNVILADEINRFPPKAQNAFIEALAEGQVTIGNKTFRLKQPFFCLATQNPTEQKGVSRLQEALSDRFMFKLLMKETTKEEKVRIAKRTHEFDADLLRQVVSEEEVNEAREYFFDNIYVSDEVRYYCARLIDMINHPVGLYEEEIRLLNGDSIFKQKPALNDRAMLHLEGAAMMEAVMNYREYVLPLDVYNIVPDVLRARLMINESSLHLLLDSGGKYTTETELIDYLIKKLLEKVEMF